jgi:hypothetical protein
VKHLFNNFNSPVSETLDEQMIFLFNKDIKKWMDVYTNKDKNVINIDRRSNYNRVFTTEISLESGLYIGFGYYESPIGTMDWGYGEFLVIRNGYTKIYIKGEAKRVIGLEHPSNELTWEGYITQDKDFTYAHGSGKWISKDGTVFLEGENVAEYGEPVFKLKYEDYKKVKHLITN